MASAREKIPQLGLWDDEVGKTSHDEIVLWAHKNAEILVRKYISDFNPYGHESLLLPDWQCSELKIPKGMTLSDLPPLPLKPTKLVHTVAIEKVIERRPEFGHSLPRSLGYADLVISWSSLEVHWDSDDSQWHITGSPFALLVEAKTVMPTLGELMRQLNTYRLVYKNVIVIAADDSLAEILKDQKISFFKYEPSKS